MHAYLLGLTYKPIGSAYLFEELQGEEKERETSRLKAALKVAGPTGPEW